MSTNNIYFHGEIRLIVFGFNDTSTLAGHFVASPREREKGDKEIEEEMKERDRGENKMYDSEETEEIKTVEK